eukprot:299741-Karenia_brevis.AAC.1
MSQRADETLDEFLIRQRSKARTICIDAGVLPSRVAARRQWRSMEWWDLQSGLNTSKKRHRNSGVQLQSPVAGVEEFLLVNGYDIMIANDRILWKQLEQGWLEYTS